MSTDRRIVIIGAGVAGLTTALELLERGCTRVTVLEQHGPGYGSSGRSAGIVETQYLDRAGIHVRDFGLRYFERFAAEHGIALVRSGYLRYAGSDADMQSFADSLAIQREFGITDPVLLTPADVEERWPALVTDGRVGAVFGPSDGYIDSYEFSLRAAAVAVARGVTLLQGVGLQGADRDTAGAWVLQTSGGTITADVVVNAAGPWAGRVSEQFGTPMPLNNQLRPKVKMSHTDPMDPLLPFVMDYVPGSGKDGIYFRSESPQEIFVGVHTDESIAEERDPDDALGPAPQVFLDRVRDLLPTRLRVPEGLELGRTWSGLYPISPDNKPIVGAHADAPDVVHVMGAGGSGIQLAPAMGRMAADLVLTGATTTFPDTDWSPARLGLAAIGVHG